MRQGQCHCPNLLYFISLFFYPNKLCRDHLLLLFALKQVIIWESIGFKISSFAFTLSLWIKMLRLRQSTPSYKIAGLTVIDTKIFLDHWRRDHISFLCLRFIRNCLRLGSEVSNPLLLFFSSQRNLLRDYQKREMVCLLWDLAQIWTSSYFSS